MTRVVLWHTSDSGASFSAPVTVAQGNGYSNSSLAIDAASGTLFIVWAEQTSILFTRSTDNGRSFSAPLTISGSIAGFMPTITVGPEGNIHVVFADSGNRDDFALPLDVVTSSNGGRSFSRPQAIPNTLASFLIGPQPASLDSYISVTTDLHDGSLYVAFPADRIITNSSGNTSTIEDNTDVFLSSSYDGGKTWHKAVRINNDPLSDADSHFQPQLVVAPNGTLYVSYLTLHSANSFIDVYLTQSSDHGASFQSGQKITNVSWNPSNGISGWAGDHQGLALGPTKIYSIWNDTRVGHLEIYTATLPL